MLGCLRCATSGPELEVHNSESWPLKEDPVDENGGTQEGIKKTSKGKNEKSLESGLVSDR